MSKIYKAYRFIISLIYPNRCPFCDEFIEYNKYFCPECVRVLDMSNADTDIVSVCKYNDNSKPLINKAKEDADGYAMSACAMLLHYKLKLMGILTKIDIITVIPSQKSAMRKRGYSFPAVMAREIAALADLPFAKTLKCTDHSVQKLLTYKQRLQNVKGVFYPANNNFVGKNVLLVDDVSTSGATLYEAGQTLLRGGAKSVQLAAFAKTQFREKTPQEHES